MLYKYCNKQRRTSSHIIHAIPPSLRHLRKDIRGGFQKPIIISSKDEISPTISLVNSIINSDALCKKFIDYANKFPTLSTAY